MNQKIFTIFDSKANAYLTPFFLHMDGMALRIFKDCINDKNHQFGKHPEDYTLFCIGSWSDDKAKFLTNNPISLGNGIEFKKTGSDFDEAFEELSEAEKIEEARAWLEDHKQDKLKFTDPPLGDLKEVN